MRAWFYQMLVGFLVSALIQAPVMAAPAAGFAAPIGVVLQSDQAQMGSETAANGASVFDGDGLNTGGTGSVNLRFGASQAFLPPNSSAVFHQSLHGFGADLTGGTIVLSAAQGETFHLVADGAQIRPGTSQPTVAQVTKVSSTELLLSSRKGVLEVAVESEIKSIPEGTSYRMMIQPPDPADPQVTRAGGRNRVVWVLIFGAAVGTTVAVVLALLSPCKPQ